jgi:hypothetical protein
MTAYPYRWTGTIATPNTRVQCITVRGQGAQFSEQSRSRMTYITHRENSGQFKPKGGRARGMHYTAKIGARHTGK